MQLIGAWSDFQYVVQGCIACFVFATFKFFCQACYIFTSERPNQALAVSVEKMILQYLG